MHQESKILAFFVFRVTMGLNFLFHGINRIYNGINQFRDWMTTQFEETFMPTSLVDIFATILPLFEAIIGSLLIIGLLTRYALFCGGLLIAVLITGGCILGDWQMVSTQMIYAIAFFLLLHNEHNNMWAVDNLFES